MRPFYLLPSYGGSLLAQRIAAPHIRVFIFNAARFLLGALALTIVALATKPQQLRFDLFSRSESDRHPFSRCVIGCGLSFSTGGSEIYDSCKCWLCYRLICCFYSPDFSGGLSQSLEKRIWLAAFLAALGLFLLSTNGQMRINRREFLVLMGAIFWAMHVLIIGDLVQKVDVLPLAIGQYVVCGILNLALGLWFDAATIPALFSGWWTVVYTGLISVGLGYTLQIVGQRHAPPTDAAIILSLEAVFAAIGGWIFLSESLTWIQISGCVLVLSGMLVAQLDLIRNIGVQVQDG